ncbi:unnamed protein product, partial [marine sediment metagenome]
IYKIKKDNNNLSQISQISTIGPSRKFNLMKKALDYEVRAIHLVSNKLKRNGFKSLFGQSIGGYRFDIFAVSDSQNNHSKIKVFGDVIFE